jgi:hypothetical protein
MSGLLNKLQNDGSILTSYDGVTPPKYDQQTNYPEGLVQSQLDLNGVTPRAYDRVSKYQQGLAVSQLDLNGKTPSKYLDNPPR